MRYLNLFVFSVCCFLPLAQGQNFSVVQIYTDNQLINLINQNKHLSQVVLDECQLVQDIESLAIKAEKPSYQFLWGDMLAYGVCIEKDIELGLHYMREASGQGLAAATEQLGRYYHVGKFMQPDIERAIVFLKVAASQNHLAAQMRLADIYQQGEGSPLDYPILYSQLHHSVTDDRKQHKKVALLLSQLGEKMPEHVIIEARNNVY